LIKLIYPNGAGSCGLQRNISGAENRVLAFQKITDGVHVLVGNADNINGAATEQMEHNVLSFRETVVSLADICPVLAQQGMFRKPLRMGFDALQVAVSLGFAPSTLGVAANIFKVVKGARGNPDFSGRRYQDSVSRSLMSESMEKSSTNSPFLA